MRCADFYEKWKKDPNWCQKSPDTVKQIDHYLEIVSELENLGVETAAIYKWFPEGTTAREVMKIKDDKARANVIGNAAGMLRRGERVSVADIRVWLGAPEKSKSTSSSDVTDPTIVGSRTPKIDVKPENPDGGSAPEAPPAPLAATLKERYAEQEHPAPAPAEPAPEIPSWSPADCLQGKCPDGQDHTRKDSFRGLLCDAAGAPAKQMTRCPLIEQMKKGLPQEGFAPASGLQPGRFIKPAGIRIVKTRQPIVVEPSPKQWEFIDRLQEHEGLDTPTDVILELLDQAMEREG